MPMKKLLLAFQFLTIVPIRFREKISEEEIVMSSAFFPLVGAFQGAFLVIAAIILRKIFSPELTNGLLILLLVVINGGFHLDGLADTFDAIASRGNIEKKLSIMKDSTIGPIGVTAIIFILLLKFLSLNNLSHLSPFIFYPSLFLMPAISKWVIVISMFHGKPAREDGLGKIFMKNVKPSTLILSSFLIILFFLSVVAIQIFLYKEVFINPPSFPLLKRGEGKVILLFITIFALLYIFSLISVRFCIRKFGGFTGDTLGTISEITELAFLLIVIAWSHLII